MIIQGKDGTICTYWNDLLISSLPLGKRKVKDYEDATNRFILQSCRSGYKIKDLIMYSRAYCNTVFKKKITKKRIDRDEHHTFNISLLALIRLNQIEGDDVTLICPRKKSRQ
tara:strand:- start:2925 stop:3260 length:336 start_codon:yes stop_codon:yes gene_type:complete